MKNLEDAYLLRFSGNRNDWHPFGLLLQLDRDGSCEVEELFVQHLEFRMS